MAKAANEIMRDNISLELRLSRGGGRGTRPRLLQHGAGVALRERGARIARTRVARGPGGEPGGDRVGRAVGCGGAVVVVDDGVGGAVEGEDGDRAAARRADAEEGLGERGVFVDRGGGEGDAGEGERREGPGEGRVAG